MASCSSHCESESQAFRSIPESIPKQKWFCFEPCSLIQSRAVHHRYLRTVSVSCVSPVSEGSGSLRKLGLKTTRVNSTLSAALSCVYCTSNRDIPVESSANPSTLSGGLVANRTSVSKLLSGVMYRTVVFFSPNGCFYSGLFCHVSPLQSIGRSLGVLGGEHCEIWWISFPIIPLSRGVGVNGMQSIFCSPEVT